MWCEASLHDGTTLHHTALQRTTLHRTAPHCTTLQYTTTHCDALHHCTMDVKHVNEKYFWKKNIFSKKYLWKYVFKKKCLWRCLCPQLCGMMHNCTTNVKHVHKLCFICVWVMSHVEMRGWHIWMSHVTRECIMSHICVSDRATILHATNLGRHIPRVVFCCYVFATHLWSEELLHNGYLCRNLQQIHQDNTFGNV